MTVLITSATLASAFATFATFTAFTTFSGNSNHSREFYFTNLSGDDSISCLNSGYKTLLVNSSHFCLVRRPFSGSFRSDGELESLTLNNRYLGLVQLVSIRSLFLVLASRKTYQCQRCKRYSK